MCTQVNRDVQATDVSAYNLIFKLLCSGSRIFTVITALGAATAATSLQRSAGMESHGWWDCDMNDLGWISG